MYDTDPSNGPLPNLPCGYGSDGKRMFPTATEAASPPGPLPSLPEGYDEEGKKVNGFYTNTHRATAMHQPGATFGHSDLFNSEFVDGEGGGRVPELPLRTSTSGTTTSSVSDDIFAPPGGIMNGDAERMRELEIKCKQLTAENQVLQKRLNETEAVLKGTTEELKNTLRMKDDRDREYQRIASENRKLMKRTRELESHLALLQGVGSGRLRSPIARYDHRASEGTISAVSELRGGESHRRVSEPMSLIVPSATSRPTNLPLGRFQQDWENGPTLFTPENRHRHPSGFSPSSDTSRDGTYTPRSAQYKRSVSSEDLLSADDRGSMRSSGSSHASFDLSSLGNTHGTMV